jgi:hypothetical protein
MQRTIGMSMKRYLLFSTVGPFLGGLLLLMVETKTSGYWYRASPPDISQFMLIFLATLPYNYLFDSLPLLMLAAADDVLSRMRAINPGVRMIVVSSGAFVVTSMPYGDQGSETGPLNFLLYGLVGLVPAMLCSWLLKRGSGAHSAGRRSGASLDAIEKNAPKTTLMRMAWRTKASAS